jgi:exo-beta-1,3-glucanase (GH17 family)
MNEIEGLIALAKGGHVGNEVLYRNDLLRPITGTKRVKDALPNIPVGYVDAYYEFSVHPELVENTDVI